ncbi:MAG TPA: phosphatase PAP2 family protein [Candidatus Jeotgalibaca pullicola]|nr:phosphatase PAP2 family protein [Candidatus Jeotgalibaca pullicola]
MSIKRNNHVINFSKGYLIIGIICSLIFGITCFLIQTNFQPLINMEQSLMESFQKTFNYPQMNYDGEFLQTFMTFSATLGNPIAYIIITATFALVLFINKFKDLSLWFLGVISTGGLLGAVMKRIFQRPRPMGHLIQDKGFSFPSGHAIGSTLFFLTILLVFIPLIKNKGIRICISMLSIGLWAAILFSRLYFNAHYLGDLIAGISFASFWVLAGLYVYNVTSKEKSAK